MVGWVLRSFASVLSAASANVCARVRTNRCFVLLKDLRKRVADEIRYATGATIYHLTSYRSIAYCKK